MSSAGPSAGGYEPQRAGTATIEPDARNDGHVLGSRFLSATPDSKKIEYVKAREWIGELPKLSLPVSEAKIASPRVRLPLHHLHDAQNQRVPCHTSAIRAA